MTLDLFENVRILLGCEYISDLERRDMLKTAKKVVGAMDLTPYTARELADMAEFLYGKKMYDAEKETVIAYLKKTAG